jgi:DNA-binding transcriptional LysR family regulator
VLAVDVHHLRYFVAVADAGTFAAASAVLSVSASPLARRIHDLESWMGTPLFARERSGLSLTPEGERLLPHARKLLRDFGEIEELRTVPLGDRPLRLGIVPGVRFRMSEMIEEAIAAVRPGGEVFGYPADSPTQTRKILSGELDLATVRRLQRDPRLGSLLLLEEDLNISVAPAAAALLHNPLREGDLTGWTFYTSYAPTFSESLMEFLERNGVDDIRIVTGADPEGLAVLSRRPRTFSLSFPSEPGGRRTPLEEFSPPQPIRMRTYMIWRADRADLRDVVDAIRASFVEHPLAPVD